MDTAFKKDTAGCAMGKGFICIKAILKYRHGSFPQSKLSRELAKQAVIPKCRGLSMRSQAVSLYKIKQWISVPNKICDNPIKNYICDNLWTKRSQTTDGFL